MAAAYFVASHPWPSTEEMEARFRWQPHGVEISAVYGAFNHESLKKIYEAGIDSSISRALGQRIAERGGIEALRWNLTAFGSCSPFAFAVDKDVRDSVAAKLRAAWNGIEVRGNSFSV